nr:DUF3352 domain-containing protein [Pseudanabaena sp. FACHB-1998]
MLPKEKAEGTVKTSLKESQSVPFTSNFTQRSLNLAQQLPVDTIGLLVVDLDLRSWQEFPPFAGATQSPLVAFDKLLGFLLGFMGTSSEFSLTKDIQPWLGKEVAIAFLGKGDSSSDIGFAALSLVNDEQQFANFLKKLKKLNLPSPTETTYQNVKILEWQLPVDETNPPPSSKPNASLNNLFAKLKQAKPTAPKEPDPSIESDEAEQNSPTNPFEDTSENLPRLSDFRLKSFAIAKLPNGVAVLASDRQAILQMIDISNPEATTPQASLANNQLFLRSLNNPLWNRSLLAGYGDFQGIGKLTEFLAADLPETSEIPGFSREEYIRGLKYTLGQYSTFDLFTWVTPKGIRSQNNSYFAEVRSPQPKDTAPRDRLLSFLPAKVYGSINSRDLNQQWQWLVKESEQQPTYKIFVEGLRMLVPFIVGSGLDIDIEKDVISVIDGEYAFAVFPSDLSPFKEFGTDVTMGMLIRTSKPEVANATLAKITNFLANLGKETVQVKKRQVGATLLTSFEFPDNREAGKTQSAFAYGWRDRQTLLLSFGASTAAAFIPNPKPSLAETEDFREAIAEMPQPNFGYFYLNANAIAKQVANLILSRDFLPMPENPPEAGKPTEIPAPILNQINKLGGVVFSYAETSDRLQSDFFLGLKP